MTGGKILDRIEMRLRNHATGDLHSVYFDIYDNSLSRKWLIALNDILNRNLHLEKNYCFFGFADGARSGQVLIDEISKVIDYINNSSIDYTINDQFTLENSLTTVKSTHDGKDRIIVDHDHFNKLHLYFEELEGTTQNPSRHALNATPEQKWYIRQTNLLCHEFESWALSYGKKFHMPEWQRPSQLMCWINAPEMALT